MTTSDYLEQLIQDRDDLVDNLTTKGISGLTGDETFTELVPEVLNIPSGGGGAVEEKDVNFYDYDGTITNSYTAQEFLALTSMPDNPTHEGLTAQGWNWTLTDAQDYVTSYGMLNIGQMYVTDDGKTRIYIHLEDGRLKPYLSVALYGSATVDWGDDSSLETINGTSMYNPVSVIHNYSQAGDYKISITPSENVTLYLVGTSSIGSEVLFNNKSSSSSSNRAYQNAIRKIEIGNNAIISSYAFQNCQSLSSITIPASTTSIQSSAFYNCYSLSSVVIPSSVTSIASFAFQNCYALSKVSMPNSLTSLGTYCFSGCARLFKVIIPNSVQTIETRAFTSCYSLAKVTLPSSVTGIDDGAFYQCYPMGIYDFTKHTSIPVLGSNVFQGIDTDCKIIVPDSLYADWIVATNWSNYASYIIKESEWNA